MDRGLLGCLFFFRTLYKSRHNSLTPSVRGLIGGGLGGGYRTGVTVYHPVFGGGLQRA